MQDLLGHELNPLCYPIFFEQTKLMVEKFFDASGQVIISEQNTLFVENVIFVMRCMLESKSSVASTSAAAAAAAATAAASATSGGMDVAPPSPAHLSSVSSSSSASGVNSSSSALPGAGSVVVMVTSAPASGTSPLGHVSPLSTVSVESLLINIVKYVRHLDTSVAVIQLKAKVCQLVETVMRRREDLLFRQEMKFRNKLVEYLTDWIMGSTPPPTHHQYSVASLVQQSQMLHRCGNECIEASSRDLDQSCMEATAALLAGLPLQPEENDKGDILEPKSQLFLKYFTLFINLLNDCSEESGGGAYSAGVDASPGLATPIGGVMPGGAAGGLGAVGLNAAAAAANAGGVGSNSGGGGGGGGSGGSGTGNGGCSKTLQALRNSTIVAMSNLLNANIESGLMRSIALG